MPNLPGPYELEFIVDGYTAPARPHYVRFNCIAVGNPTAGTPASSVTMQKAGGGTGTLDTLANSLWGFLRLFYATTISCTGYTLWKYQTGTFAKDYITSADVTIPAGTGGVTQNAHQLTQTYRSANGGIMKVVLLETTQGGTTRTNLLPNPAGTPSQRLAAFLLSVDGFAIARDDGFPVQALRDSRGENEDLFRTLYRS